MNEASIIEAKKTEKPENGEEMGGNNEHAEALDLVEEHRDFFEHYAKGKIKIEPAPTGIPTFAFNLETNTIYVNTTMFKKVFGFTDEKTIFLTLHEIEHFMEKIQILSEDGGEKKFEKYLKRRQKSKAFSLTDNCVADIREYRALISKTNKGMEDVEKKTFKQDLFEETDFTKLPKHIQFNYALLREARVLGEQCQVSGDVRQALDEVAKVEGLLEIMTHPETPMSTRLKLQDKYIWPKVEALLEKDIEDKKKQKEQEKGEGEGEPGEQGDRGEGQEGGEDGGKSEKQDGESKKGKKSEKSKGDKGEKSDGGEKGKDEGEETDPNKLFADEYAEAEKKFPEAVPLAETEKAFKKWKESQKKNSSDKADEDYAQKIGVEKKDLQNYRNIVENLKKIVNPETNVSIVEELKNLFSRIISKRLQVAQAPRYPVEEGDELVDPAQLVADVKSGNLQPKVWEDTEMREKRGDRFGEVEITLVCDRSGSMGENDGKKAEEQRKSVVLLMEVLKEFAELCEAAKMNIDKPLQVKSEIYSFASNSEDKTPLKKMSTLLGEAERIHILKKLYDVSTSATTTDFNCLEAIDGNLDENTKGKIKLGELKKIVIVFTDGGSDNPSRVQGVLKSLRDSGVVAIGVGITSEGSPVLSTYATHAQVVEDVHKLPIVLGALLKEHLKDL